MLSDAKARRLKPDDKPVSDGTITGLYLVPAGKVGTGKWILRFVSPVLQKRREMGLGSYPTTPIRDARIRALEARNLIEEGTDPLEERKAKQEALERLAAMPTFEEAARRHHKDRAEGFRNAKHRAQWITTLKFTMIVGMKNALFSAALPPALAPVLTSPPARAAARPAVTRASSTPLARQSSTICSASARVSVPAAKACLRSRSISAETASPVISPHDPADGPARAVTGCERSGGAAECCMSDQLRQLADVAVVIGI
jgi:hypothetical protein